MELRWVIKCVISNFSTNSCKGIADVFRSMFADAVPDEFSLGRTKAGYYITEALGPYFRDKILSDAVRSHFSIHFDETTNAEGAKELQVGMQYWSSEEQQISFKHLETFFIGKADGETLAKHILKAMSNGGISLQKIITVGRDGPNVNKTVMRILNEDVKSERGSPLLDIGSCNLHIFHNAFQDGLQELESRVEALSTSVYNFFDGWPSRWESFTDCRTKFAEKDELNAQLTEPASKSILSHRFIKHANTRWLTLSKSAERLDEQWPYLHEFFLNYIPNAQTTNSKTLMDQVQYRFIVECLKDPPMRAEVAFVVESANIIDRVSLMFQKREPMSHALYEEVELLTATIVGRACKPNTNLTLDSLEDPGNRLPLVKVQCGDKTNQYLKNVKNERSVSVFKLGVQKHFIAIAKHLVKKSVLSGKLVTKHFRCLKPEERTKERSERSIAQIARALPLKTDVTALVDEGRLLSLDADVKSKDEAGNNLRIDHYWRQFFAKQDAVHEPKYPKIIQVVKAVLAIPHGSAEVERSFSISGQVLTPDKNRMSEKTLNAKLNIKSAMQIYDCKPDRVPITRELLTSARFARSKYQEYLEQERLQAEKMRNKSIQLEEDQKKKEEDEKRQAKTLKDVETLEVDLDKANKDFQSKRNAIEKLAKQANESLKNALKRNDMNGVRVAQGMLDRVESMKEDAKESEKIVEEIRKRIEKRKSSLLSCFAQKRQKT